MPLKCWEAHIRSRLDAGDLAIHLTDERETVGKTLTVLGRLGITVKRATVTPGAGETAVLRVDLVRAMRPEQVSPLVEKPMTLKYVSRVDTTDLNLNEDEEDQTTNEAAVDMIDYGIPTEDVKENLREETCEETVE